MTNFTKVISVVFLLALVVLCQQVLSHSRDNQALKEDYSEINHIKWGLFSVDEWKRQLEVIVSDEIGSFDLTPSNEKKLKVQVEAQLGVLIDKVVTRIRESNEGSMKGRLKQAFINAVVDVNEIKAGIPQYADAIMNELGKSKNERTLKSAVKKQVATYFDKTFKVQNTSDLDRALERAGTPDMQQAKIRVASAIFEKQELITQQSWLMIGSALVLFLLIGMKKGRVLPWEYLTLLAALILLLVVGVATPMIDMEAKISHMSFILLDHEIAFANQILYFQSKSIMDVFWVMVEHPDLPMKLVGILVVTFSVILPITKMISACLYYFDFRGARGNRVVEFFTMKVGKWSMSDVLVVAIFMAYIGFNGVIGSQLSRLQLLAGDADLLTTNGTSLQPGFYLFLAYVLMGLFLAVLVGRRDKVRDKVQTPT